MESIHIDIELDPRINLATQQNDVPVLKTLRLTNLTTRRLDDLQVRVSLDPQLAPVWHTDIVGIEAGSTWNADNIDLELSAQQLIQQVERQRGRLTVEVRKSASFVDQLHDDSPLARASVPIEVLAYNEWSGASSLPELICAFVMPNHPATTLAVQIMRNRLEAAGLEPHLDGYQSKNPETIRGFAVAAYETLQTLGIAYTNPPPSFEKDGQKVRTPEQVVDEAAGTCLDLVLFTAGLLEHAGVFPLIMVVEGHALVGMWVNETILNIPAFDDLSLLRKRVELGEALLFDVTAATRGATFAESVAAAAPHLQDASAFHFAVDVRTARQYRIRPLPMRSGRSFALSAEDVDSEASRDARNEAEAPDHSFAAIPPGDPSADDEPPPTPAPPEPVDAPTRLERWKSHLLDLTMRNKLLNFRQTRTTLPLMVPTDPEGLTSLLARLEDGHKVSLHERPRMMDGESDVRSAEVHEARTGEDAMGAFLAEDLGRDVVHIDLTAEMLAKSGVELFRSSRRTQQETGGSTLYLSVGMLRWFETEQSQQARLAPLLLFPAQLIRTSVREPLRLQLEDNEPRVNVTLLRKLEQEFGLQPEGSLLVHHDEGGTDIAATLQRCRRLIVDVPRWQIEPQVWLGQFSFTKYLMWLDLEARTEALLESPVVQHLFEGQGQAFPQATAFESPRKMDTRRPVWEDFTVVDADSSQLSAVFAAADGNSFVLQGPPGTGKSQTITNLIAHLLATQRTVLFVAEKAAALEVVQRRLDSVGLGPFCLELHSNKASKRQVVEQLEAPLKMSTQFDNTQWKEQSKSLQQLRLDLNAHVKRIHAPGPAGRSVYQATAALVGYRNKPEVTLEVDGELDADCVDRMAQLAATVARVGAEILASLNGKNLDTHPYFGIRHSDWTPQLQRDMERVAGSLRESIEPFSAAMAVFGEATDHTWPAPKAGNLNRWHELASQLCKPPPGVSAPLLQAIHERPDTVRAWLDHGTRRHRAWNELEGRWIPALITDVDLRTQRQKFVRWTNAFFLLTFFALLWVRWELRRVVMGPLPDNRRIASDLSTAIDVRSEDGHLRALEHEARLVFGDYWKGADSDWQVLSAALGWTEGVLDNLAFLEGQIAPETIAGWVETARTDPDFRRVCSQLGKASDVAVKALNEAVDVLALDRSIIVEDDLQQLTRRSRRWAERSSLFRQWTAWGRARNQAAELGLQPVIDALHSGALNPADVIPSVDKAIARLEVEGAMEGDPELARFRGRDHEDRIAQFRTLDVENQRLTREEIRARLAARLPDAQAPGEMEVVRRELKKKRRHLPVRKLFAEIPHTLQRLKPCVLMSPLSVAQYLDPTLEGFDVVVFDEASQIPPWDAVGAIARGQQVVVVGDSKQLPPTSFFQSVGDEVDEVDIEDMESILDDCVVAGLPVHDLRWHYRSRHESLIAFSNAHYYNNRLHTFPAADADVPGLGVKWVHVEHGHYDQGKSRTNQAEAEAVVAEIVARLGDPARSQKSIGVVTFSQAQQQLVEDLLDLARREHPDIERFFHGSLDVEPVFVKNLENVQGDERDVMLFSIGYGPDKQGRVSMNFGPLNREGGERRLNVAITRARELLVVFSTLRADQIDLSRTRAAGVRDLKTFLDYAARGPRAIDEALVSASTSDTESPFEADVLDAVRAAGWDVHTQVGCSGYRIDLAVVDPRDPGAYLLGIECDGASYHSAPCARDRDRIRQNVLENLGWTLHRVWSTDWWLGRQDELDRLMTALHEAESRPRSTDVAPVPVGRPIEATAADPSPETAASESEVDSGTAAELPSVETQTSAPADADTHSAFAHPSVTESSMETRPSPVTETANPIVEILGDPESFELAQSSAPIGGKLVAVVQAEGPVHIKRAARLVATCWGVQRVSKRVRTRILDAVLLVDRAERPIADGEFLWPPDLHAAQEDWREFRSAGADGESRSIQEIHPREQDNAVLSIVKRAVGIEQKSLISAAAKALGFARPGNKIRAALAASIERLVVLGQLSREADKLTLPD